MRPSALGLAVLGLAAGCADPTHGWPGDYAVSVELSEQACGSPGGDPVVTRETFAWTIVRRDEDLALCASSDCVLGELPLELVGGTATFAPAETLFSFGERRGTFVVDRGYLTNDGANLHGSLRGRLVTDDACVDLAMWTEAP